MKTKTASAEAAQGASQGEKTTALTVVNRKKMTVQEKIDSLHKLEALTSKHEYLSEVKQSIDAFGTGADGFGGAKMSLTCNYKEVKVSNPAIIEELTKIAKMRLQEALIKCEKEIEEFEIA